MTEKLETIVMTELEIVEEQRRVLDAMSESTPCPEAATHMGIAASVLGLRAFELRAVETCQMLGLTVVQDGLWSEVRAESLPVRTASLSRRPRVVGDPHHVDIAIRATDSMHVDHILHRLTECGLVDDYDGEHVTSDYGSIVVDA